MTEAIRAVRRGGYAEGTDFPAELNELNQLLVGAGLPYGVEMTRRYAGFTVRTATLFAPLVAVPTTTAALELQNHPSSGKLMVVDSLFAEQILATAAAQEYGIFAMVAQAKAAISLTALDIFALNGDAKVAGALGTDIITGVGTTVIANGWRTWGPPHGGALAAATPMGSWEAPINGRLLVPPGASLCIHVVGSLATASSFHCGASGWMVPLNLD